MMRRFITLMMVATALVADPFVPAAHATKIGYFGYADFFDSINAFRLTILVVPDPAVVDRLSVRVAKDLGKGYVICDGTTPIPPGAFNVTPDLSGATLPEITLDVSCDDESALAYTAPGIVWEHAGPLQSDSGDPQGIYRSTFAVTSDEVWGVTDRAYLAFGVEP